MNVTQRLTEKKRTNGSKSKPRPLPQRLRAIWQSIQPVFAYYVVILFAILITDFMIRPMSALDVTGFQVGIPSPRVVTSPLEFDYPDEINTRIKQQKAEALVSPIYRIQSENLDKMKEKIRTLGDLFQSAPMDDNQDPFEWVKGILQQANFILDNDPLELPSASVSDASVPATIFECLVYYGRNGKLWKIIESHIDAAAGRGIAENVMPLNLEDPRKSNLSNPTRLSVPVTLITPDGTRYAAPAQEIRTPLQFFDQFTQRIATDYPDVVKDFAVKELAKKLVQTAYTSFGGPTLVYDQEQTDALKEKARNEVQPVVVHVNKEETIIGRNELISEEDIQALTELRSKMRISSLAEFGYLILSSLFIFIILHYLKSYHPDVANDTRKITVIFIGILMIFALTRVAIHLSLLDLGSHKLNNVGYAIPLGTLGVILTLLVHSRLALFCCSISAIFIGIILHGGLNILALPYILVSFITSCGAIYTVSNIRQRSDLYRAGGVAIFLASALILALSFIQYKSLEQVMIRAEELKWALIWGSVNGGLISIFSIALLPIFEDFYGVVTDIKLLELSQKNEILQRLEQDAPGSYQHSMRVATLAETAAEAIGANALLTRVGCYYHDIGKIVKPQYFVENQQTFADKAKHSKLTTNMSCFLIRSHVKHGIDLAQKYKLPQVIINFIPEHHGTTLMSYFYHQALEEQGTEGSIKESDFRYPGPKPQSKETAISMLADALEAASRTLESNNERDVRQLVRKIINDRFMDSQFDECNLTLKDLHVLFLSFSESIMSMHHQRIVYPSNPLSKEKETESEKPSLLNHLEPSEMKESLDEGSKLEKNSMSDSSERTNDQKVILKLE